MKAPAAASARRIAPAARRPADCRHVEAVDETVVVRPSTLTWLRLVQVVEAVGIEHRFGHRHGYVPCTASDAVTVLEQHLQLARSGGVAAGSRRAGVDGKGQRQAKAGSEPGGWRASRAGETGCAHAGAGQDARHAARAGSALAPPFSTASAPLRTLSGCGPVEAARRGNAGGGTNAAAAGGDPCLTLLRRAAQDGFLAVVVEVRLSRVLGVRHGGLASFVVLFVLPLAVAALVWRGGPAAPPAKRRARRRGWRRS